MFSFARYIVRHKVGAVAVCAIAVFVMTPNGEEEQEQSNSPWSVQQSSVQVAQADESSFVDDIVSEASGYLEEAGIGNPLEEADAAVNRFEDTAAAMNQVNGGS
ncbi:hypothetical protein GCM10009127_29160 [Alteraurantiacibacter aestuarii]|uniref:Uncharacterized protein n=1 Tax=Alteraurantiacibacter aestuarii TaxID=650004 RepID=A0A844ZMG3_9SPHN|nr:hypothetical protein [Alteraurantiacibacter aestuarii]MXO89025.1 hypothetical protein [Alteraurantiacibacter aestuarii]